MAGLPVLSFVAAVSSPPILVMLDNVGDNAVLDQVKLVRPLGLIVVKSFDLSRAAQIVGIKIN